MVTNAIPPTAEQQCQADDPGDPSAGGPGQAPSRSPSFSRLAADASSQSHATRLVTTCPVWDDVAVIRREQYQRLERHLQTIGRPRVEMTFAEVAEIIGERLPNSAYQHPAWWGSDPKHTQAVWLDAGYIASPNLTAQKVTFTKVQ
jgi:hypothetical protein